ncbi:MAG: hypothetical protein ACXWRT_18510, partial [Bdellovibrionota bacterium]
MIRVAFLFTLTAIFCFSLPAAASLTCPGNLDVKDTICDSKSTDAEKQSCKAKCAPAKKSCPAAKSTCDGA